MTIRLANIHDLTQILALLKLCIRHMDEKGIQQWPDWYPNEEIIVGDITKNALFVAEEAGKIIAFVTLSPEIPEEYNDLKWKLKMNSINSIHRLAVDPNFQKDGIAKKLMTYVEGVAKENRFDGIRLDTYSLNTAANRFYTKIGYQYCGDINLPFMPKKYHCYEKSLLD